MKNSDFMSQNGRGGAKKFLYTGPKKGGDDEEEDFSWNFNAKKTSNTGGVTGPKNDLDNVWSIQRNVNIDGKGKQPKAEALHYNTNKSYYSRHGGGGKDKDEFGASIGSISARNETFGNSDAGNKTWTVGSQSSRRPFSYAYGNEAQNQSDKPVSPRNVSNSSSGIYPQTGSHFGLQTGSGLNSGTASFNKGGNFNSQGSDKSFNSQEMDKLANRNSNNTGFNRSSMPLSSQNGQILGHNPNSRNSVFQSSTQRYSSQNGLFNANSRSSFDGGSAERQKKSFW